MASSQFIKKVVNFCSTIIIFLMQLFENAKLYIIRKGSGIELSIIQRHSVALECMYMNEICILDRNKGSVIHTTATQRQVFTQSTVLHYIQIIMYRPYIKCKK